MRWLLSGWMCLWCVAVTGCRTTPAFEYLGVPSDEGRVVVDAQGQTTRIKPVRQASYFNFETLQRAGMVEDVQMEENFIYYSVIRRVPLNKTVSRRAGEGAEIIIVERYRVDVEQQLRPRY